METPHVELVATTTSDGLRLDGAWYSAHRQIAHEVEAVLLLHGTGSNFYSPSLWRGLIPRFVEAGYATLAVNTRGHDLATAVHALGRRRLIGASYETVDECRHDIRAWLDWLATRGISRVALLGHSMGGLKAIYAQACAPHPLVTRLVAVSAPRLAYSVFLNSPQAELFANDLARAEQLVNEGRPETLLDVAFPIPYLITAAGYLDKYGREERYDLQKFLPRIPLPMLATFGQKELNGPAFCGLPDHWEAAAQAGRPITVATIADADHIYTGCHSELAARVTRWFAKPSGS